MMNVNVSSRWPRRRPALAAERRGTHKTRSTLQKSITSLWAAALLFAVLALTIGGSASAQDPTKNPHYFGPYPNWANSPLTLPDATVAITVATGCVDGGATGEATVGANGAITGIAVTNPGNDYTASGRCAPLVTITGAGTGAEAKATVTRSGAVVAVVVDTPGGGYKSPKVGFSGGGGSGATATAYGGVDAVTLTDVGNGYTMPTVAFDLPDNPNGVTATGKVVCVEVDCAPAADGQPVTITGVDVDRPRVRLFDRARRRDPQRHTVRPDSVRRTGLTRSRGDVVDVAHLDRAGHVRYELQQSPERDHRRPPARGRRRIGCDRALPHRHRRDHGNHRDEAGLRLHHAGRDQEVRGHAAGPHLGQSEQPRAVHPARGARHDHVPGGRLLRDRPRGVQREDAYEPASDQDARLRAAGDERRERRRHVNFSLPGGKVGLDKPHFLGPTIVATQNRPVRITFYNLLPTEGAGDLFLPTDSTLMGSGEGNMTAGYDPTPTTGGTVDDEARNPMCTTVYPKPDACFKDNRATLHLHGGNTPWISDGTPHQWTTPAGEVTAWPEGVSVESVPDMIGADKPANVQDCSADDDGCQTFYYTNQQSARLMFYHDHAWGITRLNVYAGEAAGYVIRDATERKLFGPNGTLADLGDGIPLVIQDRTFVPSDAQLALQDPTWDKARWGGPGASGTTTCTCRHRTRRSGRDELVRALEYGPWFWPPSRTSNTGRSPTRTSTRIAIRTWRSSASRS